MITKQTIPPEIQAEVQKLIDKFNQKNFSAPDFKEFGIVGYSARFKGKTLYLDRDELGEPSPICRLTWNGKMDNWDFAIYKYSDGRYDPEEWFFPSEQFVDGTVTGAMKAGMKAYDLIFCKKSFSLPLRGYSTGVVARRVESLRGRMGASQSTRQVKGLFEGLLAQSFVDGRRRTM